MTVLQGVKKKKKGPQVKVLCPCCSKPVSESTLLRHRKEKAPPHVRASQALRNILLHRRHAGTTGEPAMHAAHRHEAGMADPIMDVDGEDEVSEEGDEMSNEAGAVESDSDDEMAQDADQSLTGVAGMDLDDYGMHSTSYPRHGGS